MKRRERVPRDAAVARMIQCSTFLSQDESLRSLFCLADTGLDLGVVANLSFEWRRDGHPLSWREHGDFQEDLWLLPGVVNGAVLKIGAVQVVIIFS